MADTGVAVTSMESSQLSCGSVIHVSADRFKRDWHRGILTVLRTADAEGIQSVALPALGTGLTTFYLNFFNFFTRRVMQDISFSRFILENPPNHKWLVYF